MGLSEIYPNMCRNILLVSGERLQTMIKMLHLWMKFFRNEKDWQASHSLSSYLLISSYYTFITTRFDMYVKVEKYFGRCFISRNNISFRKLIINNIKKK